METGEHLAFRLYMARRRGRQIAYAMAYRIVCRSAVRGA